MPGYFTTHVNEGDLLAYEGADFDEVLLTDQTGEPGAQVWCWTRREADMAKASWLRLIVTVPDKDSSAAVERVRNLLDPKPNTDPARPLWLH